MMSNPWTSDTVYLQAFCLQLNYNEFCNLMNSRGRRKEEEKKEEEEKEERGKEEEGTT